jgi:hypothetical protein
LIKAEGLRNSRPRDDAIEAMEGTGHYSGVARHFGAGEPRRMRQRFVVEEI